MDNDKLKWWILATVIVGTFLGRLDQTIVSLALPKIIIDFGISVSAAGWIGTAYILANAVLVPVWGKLGDTIGRKKVYIIGFTVFIIGSMLAGLAWNYGSLILFRIIQAVASSADYPTAMAIIAVTFRDGKERAQALGLWSTSFAAASVFGPLIGGPLIDTFGWRSIFLINLPIGLIGLGMAMLFIHESMSERKTRRFDWWGAISLGIALSALVLVLDKAIDWGWFSPKSIIAYVVMIVFGLIFYRIESKHEEAIIDLKFFKEPIFVGALVNNFVVFMGLIGGIFLIPIFVNMFMGYGATQTGLMFIPMSVCMFLAAQIGSRLVGKVRADRVIALSTFVAAIGMFMFYVMLDPRSGPMDVIFPLSLMSFGIGLAMSQRTNAIAAVVPAEEMGSAASVLALARNIAGAFGIAFFATILNNTIESSILQTAKYSTVHASTSLQYQQGMGLMILHANMMGYKMVFLVASVVLLVGAVLALLVKIEREDRKIKVHVE